MGTKKSKPAAAPSGPLNIQFETFWRPLRLDQRRMTSESPSCFNGVVSIKRYRVTFEEMEETREVLAERLRDLWRKCDNMHHIGPLREAAKEMGVELDHAELGRDRPR
jgi:hypothetical protein